MKLEADANPVLMEEDTEQRDSFPRTPVVQKILKTISKSK